MATDCEGLRAAVKAQRVIPVLRAETVEDTIRTARLCADNGLSVIELTTSTPDCLVAVRQLSAEGMTVGLGTVRSANEIGIAADAGARFVVSYFTPEGFMQRARHEGIVAIPGALTPSEIQRAAGEGADLVKIFPAWQSHPRVIGDLAPLVRDVEYMVTGGLTGALIRQWLDAGATAVGTGRSLGTVDTVGRAQLRVNIRRALLAAGGGVSS